MAGTGCEYAIPNFKDIFLVRLDFSGLLILIFPRLLNAPIVQAYIHLKYKHTHATGTPFPVYVSKKILEAYKRP